MLNIHNLSVSFGGSYLFEEVTFRLGSGDRVGLVGKNGAGKSTMLKILAKDFALIRKLRGKEVRMGFCVRISILSKEEQYLRKLTRLCRY
jgi:ATP-binding cassette subfamily F protein 3